jgi:hypothetical protein
VNLKNTDPFQFFKIISGRLSFCDPGIHQKPCIKNFFRGRVDLPRLGAEGPEQGIVGGDNVLDFGTCLGLL